MKVGKILGSKCSHFAVCFIFGKPQIIRFDAVESFCRSKAGLYYIGIGEVPDAQVDKIRKHFYSFPYCPKCGKRIFSRKDSK